jgi:hypothetical protein
VPQVSSQWPDREQRSLSTEGRARLGIRGTAAPRDGCTPAKHLGLPDRPRASPDPRAAVTMRRVPEELPTPSAGIRRYLKLRLAVASRSALNTLNEHLPSGRTSLTASDVSYLLSIPRGPGAAQSPGIQASMQARVPAGSEPRPVVVLELELISSCLGKADPLPALRMLTYSENSGAARSSGSRSRAGCRGGGEPPGDQPDGECQLE